jgi:hypothetical protein
MNFKKVVTRVFTVLAVAMAAFSGVMKLAGGAEATEMLTAIGVGPYVVLLGLAEILFAVLFAVPKTMKIGFLLLSCYFAGALATELSHQLPLNAVGPLVLVWIAAFLRDSSVFLPSPAGQPS